MSERDTYEVGYRKPPREHRFKPGKSGNPRGRRKGERNVKTEIAAALSEKVTITDKGKKQKITLVAAAMKRLAQKGVVEGDIRALERLIHLALQLEAGSVQAAPALDADDHALIDDFLRRMGGQS